VNARGGKYGHALQAAAFAGRDTIVQLLIERGADVNAQGGVYGGALQAVTVGGHNVIALLLETAAMVPNVKPRTMWPELKLVRCRHCTRQISTSLCTHSHILISQGSGWVATFGSHVPQHQVDVDLVHKLKHGHQRW
jgi:ankyrin repeat protein